MNMKLPASIADRCYLDAVKFKFNVNSFKFVIYFMLMWCIGVESENDSYRFDFYSVERIILISSTLVTR